VTTWVEQQAQELRNDSNKELQVTRDEFTPEIQATRQVFQTQLEAVKAAAWLPARLQEVTGRHLHHHSTTGMNDRYAAVRKTRSLPKILQADAA
jgi:hypothetical protein